MAPQGESQAPPLGPRGEGWVLLQGILVVAVVVAGFLGSAWPRSWRPGLEIASTSVTLGGAALLAGGIWSLGNAFTPFPRPVSGASLRDRGVYTLVRHPVYGGVLLLGLGWALWSSPIALVALGCLATLFEGKRRREETWLVEAYPATPPIEDGSDTGSSRSCGEPGDGGRTGSN